MQHLLKRVRGALGMGLIWAVVWAPIAVLIGTKIIDPTDVMDEMWFMVGALPGFLSGVLFSAVLSRVARRQRLSELSAVRVGGWGAVAGALIGTLPFILGDAGGRPWALLATVVVSSITVLSAASAAGSLVLAQRAEQRELQNADAHQLLNAGEDRSSSTPASSRLPLPQHIPRR